VEVLSGDTVVVQESGNGKRTVVRLLAADAPEEKQPGYGRSKRALAKLVRSRTVLVEPSLRQICTKGACVALGRIWTSSEDVALRLIRLGLLWHDTRQVPDQSTADRSLYRDAASAAVRGKKGLWAKAGAVPPWEFQAPASPRGIASKKKRAKKPLNKD
jgi:endonuclease YncB( thermonuclease family)